MLISLLKGIGIFYLWTWFIWPFVFVTSFAYAIVSMIKDEKAGGKAILIAGISLLIILAGIGLPVIG